MAMQIEGGWAERTTLRTTTKGHALVDATVLSHWESAVDEGTGFVATTGAISLTVGASAFFYLYNGEAGQIISFNDFEITLGTSTVAGNVVVEILKNPTAGTLVSAGTAIVGTNINFGSGNLLNAATLLKKSAAAGQTLTDGTVFRTFVFNDGFYGTPVTVPNLYPGNSIGLRITTLGTQVCAVNARFHLQSIAQSGI